MHNLLRFGDQVSTSGAFSAPMSFDKFSLVDIRDIAEVAAKVLMDDHHVSKIYTLTGPGLITYMEIAEHLSDILNRPTIIPRYRQKNFIKYFCPRGHHLGEHRTSLISWKHIVRIKNA